MKKAKKIIKRKNIILWTFVFLSLTFVGCGTPLYDLTADEERLIVSYSAEVLSKYNIYQMDGIQNVSYEPEEAATPATEPETESESKEGNTAEQKEPAETVVTVPMEEALGVNGIAFTYKGMEVTDHYDYKGASSTTAAAGNQYIVLSFDMKVTSAGKLDLVKSKKLSFSLNYGEGNTIEHKSTVLPNDLTTYYGEVKEGTSEVIVLFETSKDKATQFKSSENFTLSVDMNGKKSTIKL